jgi:hypothetical protein
VPTPGCLVVKNGSNTRSSGSIPAFASARKQMLESKDH